jgi:hypothetical protein
MVNYNFVKEIYRGLFLVFLRKMRESDFGQRLEEDLPKRSRNVSYSNAMFGKHYNFISLTTLKFPSG